MSRTTFGAIVVGGLVAGTLDILYAITFYWFRNGVQPIRILQSVASGLLGKSAYQGGVPTAALGLALHFFIALSAAAVFVALSRHVPAMADRPVLAGAVFGVGVYAFMNLVVVPLSRFPQRPSFPAVVLVTGLLAHVFLIGIPIGLAARRTSSRGA